MYTEKDPWIYFIHREAVAAVAGNWKSWIFPTDSLGCKHINKEFAVRLVTHHALEPLSTGRQVGKSSKTCVKLATGCQRQGFFFNVKIKFELEMIHMLCTDPIPTFCALRHLQTQTQGPCSKSSVLPQIVYPCFARLKKKNRTRSICQKQRLLQFGTGIFNHGKSQTSIWSNSVHLICWTSEVCSYLLGNPALPRNQDEPHWTRIHEFTKLRFSRRTVNLVQNQHLWHFIKYLWSCNFRHLTLEINSKINPVLLTAWILNFVSIHWNLPHQWGKKALQASCPNINLLQFRCYR